VTMGLACPWPGEKCNLAIDIALPALAWAHEANLDTPLRAVP
jgi:hypothetical protein